MEVQREKVLSFEAMPVHQPIFWKALGRGLRQRCPRCGQGCLLASWFSSNTQCSECALVFARDPVDLGAFMYISTVAITGLFVLGFLFIGFPNNLWTRIAVVAAALALMVLTTPLRRCVGIAVLYASDVIFAPSDEGK